jgi:hypothetical protein
MSGEEEERLEEQEQDEHQVLHVQLENQGYEEGLGNK